MDINPGWYSAYLKFKSNARFSKYRLKALNSRYLGSTYLGNTVDILNLEEFIQHEADRLPLFVGSQFGIFPGLESILLQDGQLVAVLCKSVLSGAVSGLRISIYNEDLDTLKEVVYYSINNS